MIARIICCCLNKKNKEHQNPIPEFKSVSPLNISRSDVPSLSSCMLKSTSDVDTSTIMTTRPFKSGRKSTSDIERSVHTGNQLLLSKHRSCNIDMLKPELQIDENIPIAFENAYTYDVLLRKASLPCEKNETPTETTSTFEG